MNSCDKHPRDDHELKSQVSGSASSSQLLTYQQAADVLQVSARTVFTLVKNGGLTATRFGHNVRIDRCDLDAFIEKAKGNNDVPCDGDRQSPGAPARAVRSNRTAADSAQPDRQTKGLADDR